MSTYFLLNIYWYYKQLALEEAIQNIKPIIFGGVYLGVSEGGKP